jgi:hypothetical protein
MSVLKKLFAAVAVFAVLFGFAFAGGVNVEAQFSRNPDVTGIDGRATDVDGVREIVIRVANILIGVIAAISVFYIIYGAVLWMNNDAEKGRKVVVNAAIGLVIALISFLITQFVVGAGGLIGDVLGS